MTAVVQSGATTEHLSPEPRLPERVRGDTAAVTARAHHVHIDDGAVAALARALVAEDPTVGSGTPWDVRAGPDGDEGLERAVATAVVLDTVNFGSGWNPVLRKPAGRSGATTIAAGVRAWLDAGTTHASRFGGLTAADLAEICHQPRDEVGPMELMGLLAAALDELAAMLSDVGGGRVLPVLTAGDGTAAGFAEVLASLPSFHDVSEHDGRPVALYKRAQLAAADVARAGAGHPITSFPDLDRLTAFADNLVPHVLRLEGVLVVDPSLVDQIDRGELLPHGSCGEVEIRAVGVQAVERLCAEMGAMGSPITPFDLDGRLWRRGGAARFKARPRHRTRCTAY